MSEAEENQENQTEKSQTGGHQAEGKHPEGKRSEAGQAQDMQGLERTADFDDGVAPEKSSSLKTVAGTAHRQVLKTRVPIRELVWNDADTLISYLEEDVVYLVDSRSHTVVGAVEFPGVLDYSMFIEEDGVVHIIAGSRDGTIAVWGIPYEASEEPAGAKELEPHFMNKVPDGRGVDLLAFSDDSNYIAEFFGEAGELGIHYKLRYTNELISKKAAGAASKVYSMAFSDDNSQLASATTDGRLLVWSTLGGRLMYEHTVYAESKVPVHFIEGTYNLLVACAEDRVGVLDPTGMVLRSITTSSPVVDTKMLSDKLRVAVLTKDNRIEIYSLEGGTYLGYVPSFNITAITSFDFNSTDNSMVVGHEDGSIYKIDLETNVLAPRTRPVLRLIGMEEVVVKGTEFTLEIPPAAYSDMGERRGLNAVRLFPEPWHSVDFLVGTTFLPEPFTQSVDVQLGYNNGFLLHPFFFGMLWRSSWGFPQANFPYIYYHGDVKYDSPLLVSWVLEIPFGLAFAPWDFGLEIHTEVTLGFAMHELWNRRLGNQAVTAGLNSSYFHGAFVTALTLGVAWKGITLKFSGEWDSEFGWSGQVVLGYSFNLPVPQKFRSENISQVVASETLNDGGATGEEETLAEAAGMEELP